MSTITSNLKAFLKVTLVTLMNIEYVDFVSGQFRLVINPQIFVNTFLHGHGKGWCKVIRGSCSIGQLKEIFCPEYARISHNIQIFCIHC